jgi:hypothetical protein
VSKPFFIEKHSPIDKKFAVNGPGDLVLWVDYDDVDHDKVDADAERMVEILNVNWEK